MERKIFVAIDTVKRALKADEDTGFRVFDPIERKDLEERVLRAEETK